MADLRLTRMDQDLADEIRRQADVRDISTTEVVTRLWKLRQELIDGVQLNGASINDLFVAALLEHVGLEVSRTVRIG